MRLIVICIPTIGIISGIFILFLMARMKMKVYLLLKRTAMKSTYEEQSQLVEIILKHEMQKYLQEQKRKQRLVDEIERITGGKKIVITGVMPEFIEKFEIRTSSKNSLAFNI